MEIFPKKFSRRHFLGLGGMGVLGYMRFGEPIWLDVGRHQVAMGEEGGQPPLTLLHLSDLHVSKFVSLDFVETAIDLALRSCRPDLICLTGDFITWTWEDWDGYSRVIRKLSDVAPTYACIGNHDGGSWAGSSKGYADHDLVDAMLGEAKVTLLHNRAVPFDHAGWKLNLVGVGDWWTDEMEAKQAFATADPARRTILLSHNPDTKTDLLPWSWNLMLSGHTHGGQLDLPVIGTPFAPIRDKRYVRGLHRWNDRWLHITKGVGNLHGMRFNCRPEVSVLTLV